MGEFIPPGLGWLQSLPDARDLSPSNPEVQKTLTALGMPRRRSLPAHVDLTSYFPAVSNQKRVNSSTAFAWSSILEYFERRTKGTIEPLSPLFLYKVTRNLLLRSGDCGADLRSTIKAAATCGVPPERYWPYEPERFDEEPSAFVYTMAESFDSQRFIRLDPPPRNGAATLDWVRAFLAAGFPLAFGFVVPVSISSDPDIPYRPQLDSVHGGHAAVAVGFDNDRISGGKGALLIRSSWGDSWGNGGYGWLPYAYVLHELAVEFWTVYQSGLACQRRIHLSARISVQMNNRLASASRFARRAKGRGASKTDPPVGFLPHTAPKAPVGSPS